VGGVRLRFKLLASGSSGNAAVVEAGATRILLDAGLGPRVLAERLGAAGVEPGSVETIFLSHEHNDHIHGAARFSKRWGAPLAASRGTLEASGVRQSETAGFEVLHADRTCRVGPLAVTALAVPHDARAPFAFLVGLEGRSEPELAVVTDLGHVPPELAERIARCRALVLEANHDVAMLRDGPYAWPLKERILSWTGHLSNRQAARHIEANLGSRCRTLVLAHLSKVNNHPEVALMEADKALKRAGRTDVELIVASPDGTRWIEIAGRAPRQAHARGQMPLF
jgi:phosphoribosyl 1,2-cyclic phosphodiesterase